MYRVVKIEEIVREANNVKTFFFHDDSYPEPGQFYMIWIPGVDEFPMSISYIGTKKGFTVKKIGAGTSAMHSLSENDRLWIRGPYGHGFTLISEPALVVGGGSGMATLGPLIEKLPTPEVIIAARTDKEIIFRNRFRNIDVHFSTDDGSIGFHGFATELAEKFINKKNYKEIYACGPEPMLIGLIELAKNKNIKIQASLERFMKCGIGICDSCSINGYRVCVDGPVFTEKELFAMSELGKINRSTSGKRMRVH